MFRRVASAVPAQAGRVLASGARPNIASPIRRAAPATVVATSRRQYHEKVLDHYNRPRNVGSMSKADTDVGTGLVGAPACGDVMKLQIRVDPNNNTISDVKFKTFGCGSAIASSSYLTELVRGMTLEDDESSQPMSINLALQCIALCLPRMPSSPPSPTTTPRTPRQSRPTSAAHPPLSPRSRWKPLQSPAPQQHEGIDGLKLRPQCGDGVDGNKNPELNFAYMTSCFEGDHGIDWPV